MVSKSILRNTVAQLTTRIISSSLAFVTVVLLARYLGVFFFGEYIKVSTYIMLFFVMADFGLNTVYLQITGNSADAANSRFGAFLGLRLVWSLLLASVAIYLAFGLSLVHGGFTQFVVYGIALGSVAIVAFALSQTSLALFQKNMRYDLVTMAAAFGSAATLLLSALALVWFGAVGETGFRIAIAAFTVGVLVTAAVNGWQLKKFLVRLQLAVDWDFSQKLFRQSLPLGLVLVCNLIYFRLDLLILSYYRPSVEVGAYGLAYKFFEFALTVPAFVMNSYYPQLLVHKKPQLTAVVFKLALGLLGLSIAVAGLFWFAAYSIPYIKAEYAQAVGLLQLLVLFLPVFFLTSPILFLFVLYKQQRQLIKVYAGALVINLGLNLVFIPAFGAPAAAVITGVGETLVLVWSLILLQRRGFYEL